MKKISWLTLADFFVNISAFFFGAGITVLFLPSTNLVLYLATILGDFVLCVDFLGVAIYIRNAYLRRRT